jgi:uncharacterized protein (DUF169 family)
MPRPRKPKQKRMRHCKSCGRPLFMLVKQDRVVGSKYYCGFCTNPMSFRWMEKYIEYLQDENEYTKKILKELGQL